MIDESGQERPQIDAWTLESTQNFYAQAVRKNPENPNDNGASLQAVRKLTDQFQIKVLSQNDLDSDSELAHLVDRAARQLAADAITKSLGRARRSVAQESSFGKEELPEEIRSLDPQVAIDMFIYTLVKEGAQNDTLKPFVESSETAQLEKLTPTYGLNCLRDQAGYQKVMSNFLSKTS